MLAPVVVFAYNRADHLEKTINALSKNKLIEQTNIFVFADGAKNETGLFKVNEVRSYLERLEKNNNFKSFTVIKSDKNKGLANSIIGGVTEIIDKYGKVIVVEDDVITANDFLEYMNAALDFYEKNPKVWSIGGYAVPMQIPINYEHDVIIVQRVSSIAWGTWKNNWDKIDWGMREYKSFRCNFLKRVLFNKFGNDRSSMLDDQMNGRINSWAIRFDYAMWKSNMFNIIPKFSRVYHIGDDGSGTHSKIAIHNISKYYSEIKTLENSIKMDNVEIDERIRKEFIKPYQVAMFTLFRRYVSNLIYKYRKDAIKNVY